MVVKANKKEFFSVILDSIQEACSLKRTCAGMTCGGAKKKQYEVKKMHGGRHEKTCTSSSVQKLHYCVAFLVLLPVLLLLSFAIIYK